MRDSASHEMMVLVEQVVRPLPASLKRKKRIRNELSQHLLAIQAEELAGDGDPHAAWDRAKERFGDPEALSGELRQSIGRADRWIRLIERCVLQRPEETTAYFALRLVALELALSSVIFCLSPFRLGIAVQMFLAVGFGGMIFGGLTWAQDWKQGGLGVRWWLCSLGLLAIFPAALTLLLLIAGGSPADNALSWPMLGGWSLFAIIGGPLFGVLHARDMAYLKEWAELELSVE